MSLGESPLLGENVVSRFTVAGLAPAVVPLGWVSVSTGEIVADATAGNANAAPATTSPTRARLARSDTWSGRGGRVSAILTATPALP